MQLFVYQAKDTNGQLIRAEVEAASQSEAAKLLVAKKLFPLSIEPRRAGQLSGLSLSSLQRISSKDRVLFTRQLATLVKAGLPLAKALRILAQQVENPKMLRVVHDLSNAIEGGTPLSKALANTGIFSTIYISMVEAGEASGNLDTTLLQLAAQEEKTQSINSKIRGAFTYPIVVLVVLVVVMVMMITLVLPQVGKMYTDLNQPLPLTTRLLLDLAHLFVKFWYLFTLLLLGIAYGIYAYIKSPQGHRQIDRLKLTVPVFNILLKKLYMARFARSLGSLVAAGVPVLEALSISARSMNNIHLEEAIHQVANKVRSGTAMSQPISENPIFLPLVGQMIAVGEETGTIGDSLNKVAQYYEDEVDEAVRNISTLIEPATMVVLGGMVAFLIAAVLLPIYGLVSKIQ